MRRLGSAVIALLGIWALVTSFALLTYPSLLAATSLGNGYSVRRELLAGLVAITPFLLTVAFGLVLIVARDRIASALFDDTPLAPGPDPAVTLRAAVLVLGLWFSVVAVTGLFRSAATGLIPFLFNTRGSAGAEAFIVRQQLASFAIEVVAFVIEFGAGLFFVLRSERVAAWALGRQEAEV